MLLTAETANLEPVTNHNTNEIDHLRFHKKAKLTIARLSRPRVVVSSNLISVRSNGPG